MTTRVSETSEPARSDEAADNDDPPSSSLHYLLNHSPSVEDIALLLPVPTALRRFVVAAVWPTVSSFNSDLSTR